jgi:hypothetical protein
MGHIKQVYDPPLYVKTPVSTKIIEEKHRYITKIVVNIELLKVEEGKARYKGSGYIKLKDYISGEKRDENPELNLPEDIESLQQLTLEDIAAMAPVVYQVVWQKMKAKGLNVFLVDDEGNEIEV